MPRIRTFNVIIMKSTFFWKKIGFLELLIAASIKNDWLICQLIDQLNEPIGGDVDLRAITICIEVAIRSVIYHKIQSNLQQYQVTNVNFEFDLSYNSS